MIPENTVYIDGGAPVTGDGLNTFVQSVDTVSDLRAFVGQTGMQVALQGFTAPGDGGQGSFYWNAAATAADDGGVTTVVPNASSTGAWTRNNEVHQRLSFGLFGATAGGSLTAPVVTYLGPSGTDPGNGTGCGWLIPMNGIITGMWVATASAPGVGHSYSFSLVNGLTTSLGANVVLGNSAPAGASGQVTGLNIAISQGDDILIQATLPAGANTTTVRYALFGYWTTAASS